MIIPAEKTLINSGGEIEENGRYESQVIEEERKKSTSPGNAASSKVN